MENKLVGVFETEQEAIRVIDDLQKQGYRAEDISVIAKSKKEQELVQRETGTEAEEGIATGAAAGGVLGGVTGLLAGLGALTIPGAGPIIAAGPIAAALSGAVVGAGTGGLVGGLVGMGIAKSDAEEFSGYVDQGKILVMVTTDAERYRSVYETFHKHNAVNTEKLREGLRRYDYIN